MNVGEKSIIPERLRAVYALRNREKAARGQRLREELARRDPEIAELEMEKRRAGVRMVLAGLDEDQELPGLKEDLSKQLKSISKELEKRYAAEAALSEDALSICPLCHDSGLYQGRLCRCAEDILRQLEERSGVAFPPPEEARLEGFNLSLFTAEKRPEWFSGKLSPREAAEEIQKRLLAMLEGFPEQPQNLCFFGKPGTGKTWAAAAFGNALWERGYRVAFLRVMRFLDLKARLRVLEQSFNPDPEELQTTRERVSLVETADCLILDDLGSEAGGERAYSDLIQLLDQRLAIKNKCTLLTCNLEPTAFSSRYDERVGSRLIGDFVLIPMHGPDLRLEAAKKQRSQQR